MVEDPEIAAGAEAAGERAAPAGERAAPAGERARARPNADLERVYRAVRRYAPLAWLALTVALGARYGIELGFLCGAGGVLLLIIALLWSSVQSLTGGSPLSFEEALGMGAPSAAEEQKRAVLRALKDLEYERSVGKISEQDYAEFSARYRAEAKRLIESVDESLSPARKKVEAELAARLASTPARRAPKAPDPALESPSTAEPEAEPSGQESKP